MVECEQFVKDLGVLMDARGVHHVVGHFLAFYRRKEQGEVRRPNPNDYSNR